jgi:hypothetical protein
MSETDGSGWIGTDLLRAAPAIGRVVVSAGLRGAQAAAVAYVETVARVTRAALESQLPQQLPQPRRPAAPRESSPEALRLRGSELLRRSADVRFDEASHPAYMRILESLAPDEARILRFLAHRGPQPSVDVRAGLPLVSELVAPGCNMIGSEAGCRHADRVHAYLDNLHRLGLIWFSREPVKDPRRYQVLEAQPGVAEARGRAGRLARTVRRSILLTPFGEDFCAVCLPLEELEPLPPEPGPDPGLAG